MRCPTGVAAAASLLCLTTAARCAASPILSSRHEALIDPTNGTDVYGKLVNETRVILKLNVTEWVDSESPKDKDEDDALIYDFSIADTPSKVPGAAAESVVLWTPPFGDNEDHPRVPFWEPGPNLGFTPFTRHIHLPVAANTTLKSYVSKFDDYKDVWEEVAGIVTATPLRNEHGWNITRVTFVNGIIYGEPGAPPAFDVSVVAVYVMETEARPHEFVWWEVVPLSWAMGWRDDESMGWFWNEDVPKALEDKIREAEQMKLELRR